MDRYRRQRGVTLLETLIGVAIIALIAVSVYRGLVVLIDLLNVSQTRVSATILANEQIELIRNTNYESIGTVGGVPSGTISSNEVKMKDGVQFTITTTIRNIDDPFDGILGGSPNDAAPADYKLIEVSLLCTECEDKTTFIFTGLIAPKGLETATTNGVLTIQSIDASGSPVANANIQITNSLIPTLNINDVTDTNGILKIIDVVPSNQSYHVIVTKNGYSQDQTYATSTGNPNPTKPDLTVLNQTITQATFALDLVSQINTESVTKTCGVVPSVDFTLNGSKLIGTNPNIIKFSQAYITDGNGNQTISNLEWDTYTTVINESGQDLAGTIPALPISLLPGAIQDLKLVMQASNPLALLVTVQDSATLLPLGGASVTLIGASTNITQTTGRGSITQTDWSGGIGQSEYINQTQYFVQDGNISTNNPIGDITLEVAGITYATSGWLESSTFDTGSVSNFFDITWLPTNQPVEAGIDPVKVQLASTSTPGAIEWNYKGPDGTTNTFYTVGNSNISSAHNGDRYIRYKTFLTTDDTSVTPSVSDVSFTFASSCVPPGQSLFSGLPVDTYTINVSLAGYDPDNDIVTVIQNWQEIIISLNPSS